MGEAVADDAAPLNRRAWLAVGLLFLTAVLSYTDRQMLSLMVDPVRASLRIGDGEMGLLMGLAFALVYGVAGLPMGWLADRTSRRNLIIAGVAVWSVGTLGCGLARSFPELFAARLLVGLGEASLSPAAIALISDLFPPARRGRAVGVFFAGICVGVGGSFLIGGAVLNLVKAGAFAIGPLAGLPAWRVAFLVVGAPSCLWCLVLRLVPEPPRRIGREPATPAGGRGAPLGTRAVLLPLAPIFAAVALASLADNAVGAWAPSLLVRRFRFDDGAAGLDLGYLLIFAYGGGMLVGGWLADAAAARHGARGKIGLCALAAALAAGAALLMAGPTAAAALAGVGLYFAFSAIVTGSGLAAILDAAPERTRGFATALSFFFNVAVGAGLGPSLVVLAGGGLFAPGSGLGPPLAATAMTALAIAALGALLVLRRKSSS